MAITFLGNIAGTNLKTAGTTISSFVGQNVPVGALVVVQAAADNLSATTPTFTVSDSAGNTYTTVVQQAVNSTAAGGAAGAIAIAILTSPLTSGVSTITVTLSGSVTAKAFNAQAFDDGATALRSTAVTATGASTTPSVTTGTVNSGDLVVGMVAYEDPNLISARDTDTLNGSWSVNYGQQTGGGGAASNMAVATQYKIVTAAGAQTYNITLPTSTDWVALAVVIEPAVQVTATGTGTGTQTAQVPPVSFTDDFTRANSTTSVGGNWTQTGVLGIDSNAAYMVSGTSGVAVQPIQSSNFKQVVRARFTGPASASVMAIYIAYQDANNWVALQRLYNFGTWNIAKMVGGVYTGLGNMGLSPTTDGWVNLVRDGDSFYGSVQATPTSTPSRTAAFTVTGLTGNGVGFAFDTAGTSYKWDDFTARPLVTTTRTATGSGTGTQTATGTVTAGFSTVTRTATGSGTGTQTAARVTTRARTATATGTGTQTATGLVTRPRTATGTGTGGQTASRLVSRPRTATGSGTGSQSAVGARAVQRTATGSGTGTETASRTVTRARTGTATGTGTQTATGLHTAPRTATGSGTGSQTAARLVTALRTATGTGTGSQTATAGTFSTVTRTAGATGTGTATASRVLTARRTATGTGSSTATAVAYVPPEVQRQATGSGTGTSGVTFRRDHYRTATGTGNGTSETASIGTERPRPPSAPTNQGRVRSRRTTTVIAARPTVHAAWPVQQVQSVPYLVFDREADDEVMLCLA